MASLLSGGLLRDEATGALLTTTSATGATFSGGVLRGTSGELVVEAIR